MIKWILFIFMAFLLQTLFGNFGIPSNVPLALIYVFALKGISPESKAYAFSSRAEIRSALFGACVGLIDDILSGSIIGPGFLSKGIICFSVTVIFSDVVFRWTPFWGAVTLMIFTILDSVFITILRMIFTDININAGNLTVNILMQSLINLPFGIIFRPNRFT